MYTAVHIVPIVQEDFLHEDNCRTGSSGPFATLTFPLKSCQIVPKAERRNHMADDAFYM